MNISGPGSHASDEEIDLAARSVLFKHDRIYQHKIFRVNYTTYDVRRAQDVINPDTSHCNIMVLDGAALKDSDALDDKRDGPYLYARVLGVYHANVIYVGAGATDYQSQRMDILWVRWYQQIDLGQTGWKARKLDRVRFPSFANSIPDQGGIVGFLDPSSVLRACHIVPRFCKGMRYEDGRGVSFCGRDSSDWREYYVNR